MSFSIGPDCNGCGMCVRACPRGAIHSVGDRAVITQLDCNDCGMCMIVCPEHVALPDPRWPRCWGRGCPLSTNRFNDWACSEGRHRCTTCNNAMWREPASDLWICIRCDTSSKMLCPKVRKASVAEAAVAEAAEAETVEAAANPRELETA